MVNEKFIAFWEYNKKTISSDPTIKNLESGLGIARLCVEEFQDYKYALEITETLKKLVIDNSKVEKVEDNNHKVFFEFDDFSRTHGGRPKELEYYWEVLRFEGTFHLDSYALYIEKDRPIKERFYQPRRRTLKKVVDLLQKLENDELDEAFIHMPARVGKLIADDCPVLTSKGWKNHGDLIVGDKVIGLDGQYTEIVQVHPKHHTTHVVKISDGTEIECHYNHEWTVFDRSKTNMLQIAQKILLAELIEKVIAVTICIFHQNL